MLRFYREICKSRGFSPEQQQDKSPHGVQTLVVVADDSAEFANDMMMLMKLRRLAVMGWWKGMCNCSIEELGQRVDHI